MRAKLTRSSRPTATDVITSLRTGRAEGCQTYYAPFSKWFPGDVEDSVGPVLFVRTEGQLLV